MKNNSTLNHYFRYIILFITLISFTQQAKAQMVLVPDSNFRNALIGKGFGSCFVGDSIDSSCSLVVNDTALDLSHSHIQDLTGISVFSNLTYLECYANQLTTLPILPATLQYLGCTWNQLTSLSALPNSLLNLDCYGNYLPSLPTLPNSLEHINCSQNLLTSLPTLPTALVSLDCSTNQITSLPTLPNSLKSLACLDNPLTSLPALPSSLSTLDCANDQLTSLPVLPNSIIFLLCYSNQLTSLPVLPNTIGNIDCSNNQLTILPNLPNSLKYLYCQNNQLINIPDLPDTLGDFYCYNNPNLHCLPELKNIYNLQFDSINITCLPNYGKVSNSIPSLANIPLCGIFNLNACNIYWNISGNTYYDADTNCIYNSGDNRLSNYHIKLYQNGILNQQAFTGGEGYYSFDTDSLTAYQTVIDTTGIPFNVRCPQSLTYYDTLVVNDTLKYNRDFALECKPGFDLAAWSITTHGLVPGHTVTINNSVGDYSNLFGGKCASGTGGIVSIIYSGLIHYVSPASGALIPTTISGDTLTYAVADFGLVNASTVFNFLVRVDTSAQIGSQVCINITVSPATDNEPTNNTISHCFSIHGSFDPNEKEVSPQSNLDINGDRWLTYTINFQNTGTAPAEHIYILDTLNANLDISTFQLLAYSKQPYVQILNGGIAKFNFPNINLPDSTSDEANSHGYVQYRIKALDSLTAGTPISNTAYIYFDFNTPVVTNTVVDSVINCAPVLQNTEATICEGASYNFDGLVLTTTGTYSRTYLTAFGCDSIVNLSLIVIPKTTNITGTFCSGSSYNFNGITLTMPGIYNDSLTNILGCDSIIQLDLQQNLSYNDSISQSICYGDAVQFGDSTITQPGVYTQTLATTTGCDSTTTLTLEVNPAYNSNYSQTICYGETYFFNGQALSQPGVYTETLATTFGCDSITTLTLNVQALPTTTVTQSNDTLTATETNASYQWYDCVSGNLIPNATAQNFVPVSSGYYAVILTSGNCTDSSFCQYISITGLNENAFNEITISPNPSSDEFILSSPQKNAITVKVFDAFGKYVFEKHLHSPNTIIKAQAWSPGIYFMEITDGKNSSVRKLVKE